MRRFSLLVLTLVLALCATASAAVREVPVTIKATQPDDEGRAVALDGGVDFPDTGCPCPGVIINHGFLGNWTNSESIARNLAAHGYVVLRYSSRGFGKTPGEVDLMGPKERQDLLDAVHWLNDSHSPVVGGMVRHNRIGQFGGSYGGAHAWSLAASKDPAVRTVVPTATWSDIYQALLPNDVELAAYLNGFYATGLTPVDAAQRNELNPTDNYSSDMHRWVAEANSGVNLAGLEAELRSHSITGRYGNVRIPVFIVQGTNDGLFTLNQAVDAYRALAARDVPVRLYLGGIGHPPSESSLDSPEATHVSAEVLAWFDRYLKGERNGIDRMPPIEISRADYFHNKWDGTTRSGTRFPFGRPTRMYLCTTGPTGGTLSSAACPSALPAVASNGYAGQGYDQEPVTAGYMEDFKAGLQSATGLAPDLSTAPPTLTYDGPPVPSGRSLDLAGIPAFHLQAAAADFLPAGLRGATAAFQLDPKLYDVAPDGKAKLLTRGAFSDPLDAQAPGPSTEPQRRIDFDAFGLSNRIAAGHRLRITLSTEDAPYLKPTANPFAVTLFAGTSVELPNGASLEPTPALPGGG